MEGWHSNFLLSLDLLNIVLGMPENPSKRLFSTFSLPVLLGLDTPLFGFLICDVSVIIFSEFQKKWADVFEHAESDEKNFILIVSQQKKIKKLFIRGVIP